MTFEGLNYSQRNTAFVLEQKSRLLIFFFCWLKLSIMTPMKRLRVKKEPKMMKMTKYIYM